MNAIITTPYTICIVTFPAIQKVYRNHSGCPCVCESPACVTYELI